MAMTEKEAVELARRAAENREPDGIEFERLVAELRTPLVGFLRARCRSAADADVVLNETWLRFWKALPKADFSLITVIGLAKLKATQAAIDFYRRGTDERRVTTLFGDLEAQRSRWSGFSDDSSVIDRLPDQRSRSSHQISSDLEMQRLLLRLAFHETESEAWELLAYGFHHYLGWPCPQLTTAEFSEPMLRHLADRLESDFAAKSGLPEQECGQIFERLRGMVSPPDPGERTLPQCTDKPLTAKVVEGWSHNVFRRTVALAELALLPRIEGEGVSAREKEPR